VPAPHGRIEAARYLGFAVGPVLGGLLAAAGATRLALVVNGASFFAVALAAQALRARREPRVAGAEPGRAREGIAFLMADPVLARVVVLAFVSLLFMAASATAEVFFAKVVLHAGDAGYGALMTVWTIGMVLGSTLLATRVRAHRYARVALAAMALQGAGLALPTLWLVFPFALGAYLLGGAGHGTKNVVVRTLIHTRVPDDLRGRAWAAYSAGRNAAELIALAGGGLLVAGLGARWTLLLAGALPVAAVALASAWAQAARRRAWSPASEVPVSSP
jgi:MFS family permease